MTLHPQFVPALREDLIRRDVGLEAVVWSPEHQRPLALDPASRVMLEVIDGSASVSDLVADVQEVVGLTAELAQAKVEKIIERFDRGGILTTSSPDAALGARSLFVSPASSCMETSSCTGKVTSVNLEVAGQEIRVACGSPKVARRLRRALDGHLIAEQAPLGFMLRAPHRRQRDHVLVDRGGFALGRARSPDAALAMVGSHLAALVPPPEGRVRLRVRALLLEGSAVLCPFPVLFAPSLDEASLRSSGCVLLDRLAVDIDPSTFSLVIDPVPWPALAELGAPEGHAGGASVSARVDALVVAGNLGAPSASSPAALVASVASEGIGGTREEILDVAFAIATNCTVAEADMMRPGGVVEALDRVRVSADPER